MEGPLAAYIDLWEFGWKLPKSGKTVEHGEVLVQRPVLRLWCSRLRESSLSSSTTSLRRSRNNSLWGQSIHAVLVPLNLPITFLLKAKLFQLGQGCSRTSTAWAWGSSKERNTGGTSSLGLWQTGQSEAGPTRATASDMSPDKASIWGENYSPLAKGDYHYNLFSTDTLKNESDLIVLWPTQEFSHQIEQGAKTIASLLQKIGKGYLVNWKDRSGLALTNCITSWRASQFVFSLIWLFSNWTYFPDRWNSSSTALKGGIWGYFKAMVVFPMEMYWLSLSRLSHQANSW